MFKIVCVIVESEGKVFKKRLADLFEKHLDPGFLSMELHFLHGLCMYLLIFGEL